jgi:hypothetical protein
LICTSYIVPNSRGALFISFLARGVACDFSGENPI